MKYDLSWWYEERMINYIMIFLDNYIIENIFFCFPKGYKIQLPNHW